MAEVDKSTRFAMVITTGSIMHERVRGISVDRPGKIRANAAGMSFLEIENGLCPSYSPIKLLTTSTWYQRGWTYQERVLSPRKLYFSENDVFFDCTHSVKHDCMVGDMRGEAAVKKESKEQPRTSDLLSDRSRLVDFEDHLNAHIKFSLTIESEILNAFAGILQALVQD